MILKKIDSDSKHNTFCKKILYKHYFLFSLDAMGKFEDGDFFSSSTCIYLNPYFVFIYHLKQC